LKAWNERGILMIITGTVIKIEGCKAVIFTEQCGFVRIEKQPGMYVGLEIEFSSSEIINKRNMFIHYSPLVGSIAAVFIFAFLIFNSIYLSQYNIYAYVEVATNNSNLELCMNKNHEIIDVKALDDGTSNLINDLNVKSKSLENALSDILNKTDSLGLLNSDTEFPILIAAHIVKQGNLENETDNLNAICRKAVNNFGDKGIKLYFIEVTKDGRELAYSNDISMGRYAVYDTGIEQGVNFSIEYVKTAKIGEILEKINIEDNFEIVDGDEINDDNALDTNMPTATPSPTQSISINNTPNEPSSQSNADSSINSGKPSKLPTNTSSKTTSKPSQLPKNTPNKTSTKPSQQKKNTPNKALSKPSSDDVKLDTELNVDYDISIIEITVQEIEEAQNQIETVRQNIEHNINLEKSNAEARIAEINRNNYWDPRRKQEEIIKVQADLNNKIADLRRNEKELIINIINNLYKKMDDYAS